MIEVVLAIVMFGLSLICLRHLISFLKRPKNRMLFDGENVVFLPGHFDYTLMLEPDGYSEIANQPYGFGRGFKKLVFPISLFRIADVDSANKIINVKLHSVSVTIEGFDSNLEFESSLRLVRKFARSED